MKRKWLLYIVSVMVFYGVAVEWFCRKFIISKNFLYFQVEADRFPFFRLKDDYKENGVTIREGRRELAPRGGRKHKIAFVGDSNTFGVGAADESSYPELLQSLQFSWDVYNFGVPGYGLPEVGAVVNRITREGRYDIVAYNFNFNDLLVAMSGYLPLLSTEENRIRIVDDFQGKYGRVKLFAKDHLKSMFLIRSLLEQKGDGEKTGPKKTDTCPSSSWAASEPPIIYSYFDKLYSDEGALTKAAKYLQQMKDSVQAKGSRLVVFLHYDFPFFTSLSDVSIRRAKSLLQSLQIDYWETFPIYSQHFQECEFYSDPGHLGALGNRHLAIELKKRLVGWEQSRPIP